MCDAGRIRHHLKHNLWREECAIVFVGYQGEGTLGRHLLEGAKQVRLFGEEIAVNASIYNFQGLSSHADRDLLLQWIDQVKDPAPQQIFVVHGDAQVTEIFANTLREKGLPAHAPLYEEVFDLARNVMLAAGVEIAPKKTSFASTGRPSTAYHELGAGRHGSAVHHPGQQGRRQQGPEEDGSTAQGSYREMEGRLSGRSVWTDGPFPLGGRSVCVSRRVCRAEDGEVPKRKEER